MARGNKINWHDKDFYNRMVAKVEAVLSLTADLLESDIKRHFTLRGAGRLYRKRKGVYHRASLPGQPPAIDSGDLRTQITSEKLKTKDRIIARAGTNLVYARALELGNPPYLAPRPYLRPALDRVHRQVVEMLKR